MKSIAAISLATISSAALSAPIALPMKRGFYAMQGTNCAAASKSYDKGMAIVGNDFSYGDGANTLSAVKKTGPTTYLLTFSSTDEGGGVHRFTAPIKLLPNGYWIKNSMATGNWIFCSPKVPSGWAE